MSHELKVERPESGAPSPESRAEGPEWTGQGETPPPNLSANEPPTAGQIATSDQVRAAPVEQSSRLSTLVSRLLRIVPTAIVLAVLAGIGYWGHHTGWKIPKFSELGGQRAEGNADWCEEHGVPESICIACNAELMPKGKPHGWCKEHGVAECVLHHPERAQLKTAPEMLQTDLERAERALALKERPKNNPTCKLHLRRIQFASRKAADKAGIDIALVDRGPIVEAAAVTGEIIYDPTRVARLSSRTAGTVWRVERNIGDRVKEGEVLALIDAAEVGRAKAELLQAVTRLHLQDKTYERLAGLGELVVPGQRVQEAEAAKEEAEVAVDSAIQTLVNLGLPITYEEVRESPSSELRHKVHFLGLPPALVQGLDPVRTTSNLIPVVAPRDGIVVTRDVVAGEFVETAQTLFTVADTTRMWLTMNVPLEEAKHVALGQKVVFQPDGHDEHEGTVTWISTAVDMETRTVKVRAELSNDDGHLRDETFGAGQIVLREEPDAIVVPNEAVHWEGCCHVAFVRDKGYMKKDSYKVFHTRMVRPGVANGDYTEMIAGLLPGEVVVTKGSGVLRAELLKGNLGAG